MSKFNSTNLKSHLFEILSIYFRNQSVGVCALTAKLGGVTTMGLELLSSVWAPAPTLIMGVTALGAGGLALGLPETLHTR